MRTRFGQEDPGPGSRSPAAPHHAGAADDHKRRRGDDFAGSGSATVTQSADAVAARILVADDEPGIRSFIGRALGAAGYAADFAATGAEALRRALASHYNLVILDLVMPDMAGQVVLERLLAARPDQAVLVLSCLADVAAKVDCLERGAQDYLTKPFSLAELLARVRVRLRGGSPGRARPGGRSSGPAASPWTSGAWWPTSAPARSR